MPEQEAVYDVSIGTSLLQMESGHTRGSRSRTAKLRSGRDGHHGRCCSAVPPAYVALPIHTAGFLSPSRNRIRLHHDPGSELQEPRMLFSQAASID